MSETISEPKKELWHVGVNHAADAVVINRDEILLILRKNGQWALPGGFVDKDESSLEAARREAFEETGFIVVVEGRLAYEGIVDDPRNSDDRWIETTAYWFEVETNSAVEGRDDAQDAKWFALNDLPDLYASHRDIVERALLLRALEKGTSEPTRGGHMSYDYQLHHSDSHGPLFAKRHVARRHVDAGREERSRLYLKKEADVLSALREREFPSIPQVSTLYGDSLLIIEGLPASQQWHWRIPEDPVLRHQYVMDCLAELGSLDEVDLQLPDVVTPSIVSFVEEGWDSLDNEAIKRVHEKVHTLRSKLHPETAVAADRMLASLDDMRQKARAMDIVIDQAFSHHDARPANMAWHPEHGVRIVDWSWAGMGVKGADTTSFLIDIAKGGYDVSRYLEEYFNADHALTLIGFWLGHSIWESKEGNEDVRLH